MILCLPPIPLWGNKSWPSEGGNRSLPSPFLCHCEPVFGEAIPDHATWGLLRDTAPRNDTQGGERLQKGRRRVGPVPIPSDMELIIRQGSVEFRPTGLRVSSVIRTAKLVPLKQSLIYRTLGKLDDRTMDEVNERLARAVGLRALIKEIAARRAAETQAEEWAARIDHLEERLAKMV